MIHEIVVICAVCSCQIFSQHNIYEAGQKKVAFKYLTEKVCLVPFLVSSHFFLTSIGNRIFSVQCSIDLLKMVMKCEKLVHGIDHLILSWFASDNFKDYFDLLDMLVFFPLTQVVGSSTRC